MSEIDGATTAKSTQAVVIHTAGSSPSIRRDATILAELAEFTLFYSIGPPMKGGGVILKKTGGVQQQVAIEREQCFSHDRGG